MIENLHEESPEIGGSSYERFLDKVRDVNETILGQDHRNEIAEWNKRTGMRISITWLLTLLRLRKERIDLGF